MLVGLILGFFLVLGIVAIYSISHSPSENATYFLGLFFTIVDWCIWLGCLALIKFKGRYILATNLVIGTIILGNSIGAGVMGGPLVNDVTITNIVPLVVAFLVLGIKPGIIWGLIIMATHGLLLAMQLNGFPFPVQTKTGLQNATDYILLWSILYIATQVLMTIVIRVNGQLKQERDSEREKLAQLAINSEQENTAKSAFLAMMSHEIRTPMNGVLGLAELLQDTELTAEQRKLVKAINLSGNTLLKVLNDVLDQSKISQGKIELESISFDFINHLQNTLSPLQLVAQKQHVKLSLRLDNKIPAGILGDPTRLAQVLNNIVSNAIKFAPNGNIDVRVSLTAPEADSQRKILFEIQDDGIGIDDADIEKIFDPYQQAEASTSRQYGGSGLGLALCKQLVELMSGSIGVESKKGEGARFWFSLPLIGAPELRQNKQSELDKSSILLPLNILVAEDNHVNKLVMQGMLKNRVANFEIVDNGQQAFDKIKEGKIYDAILMDCEMPIMDGYEATRKIRQWEQLNRLPSTPIIAVTAHALDEFRKKAEDCGMDHHISKPLSSRELHSTLRSLKS